MDGVIKGFLERNLPDFADRIEIELTGGGRDYYSVRARDGRVRVAANAYVPAFAGLYAYLQTCCGVQYSWCGNRKLKPKALVMFEGELKKELVQKYRVYLNYCTLDYSMCWWDFKRWEREIDFMAMNGINMPLCVVGSEAVWYETLLQFGFTEKEALSTVSGPAFWAWQLMTNIEGYLPPKDAGYIRERLELGRKILARCVEFGMQPIQQGFSGHVPMLLRGKYPKARIRGKMGWCLFPKTAQLDPLDPLFQKFGRAYLENLKRLFGNYHYLACDPFHEGTPPKPWSWYLNAVGRAINRLYESFDPQSVWVMQGWTPRGEIIRAVPKKRLLILDLDSGRTPKFKNFWGYPVVAGMLHDFGGKNPMQGKLRRHSENTYLRLKNGGANVVGTGMFMEGIEQNPAVYDLQFRLLTEAGRVDFTSWLDDYILRRYGKHSGILRRAWDLMTETCYSDCGYGETAVGSTLASRPQLMPGTTGPCCKTKIWYDTKKLEEALALFLSVSEEYRGSDGYQYDLCDLTRQALSNRFHDRQLDFAAAYRSRNLDGVKKIAQEQLDLLLDLDALLSHRSEFCLSRWICDCHALATSEEERRWFDRHARTLITIWGPADGNTSALYDYAWREWSGLIHEYYYVRWKMFYDEAVRCLEKSRPGSFPRGGSYVGGYVERYMYRATKFGRELEAFELSWTKTYSEYERPEDSDVVPAARELAEKWKLGS